MRSHILIGVACTCVLLLAALAGPELAWSAPSGAPAGASAAASGSLSVRVVGLPSGQPIHGVLHGPDGLKRSVSTAGLTISKARAGVYRLTLRQVTISRTHGPIEKGAIGRPVQTTTSVRVRAGHRASLVGTYGTIINPGVKTLQGGAISVTGPPEDPTSVVLSGHQTFAPNAIISMPPSVQLPRGLLDHVTAVSYSGGNTVLSLTAASIYEVAPNFQFDIPLQEPGATAADFSAGADCGLPAGLSPYRHIKDVSFSGGWSTVDVFGVHVTDGVRASVHFTVEAGLEVTAGAGLSCSLSLAFNASGMAGPIPVTAGIEGDLSGSAGVGGVLKSGGSIEVSAGGHTVGFPPAMALIPDVSFDNPHFTMTAKQFAQATAGIGVTVKAGVGVGGAASLTLNVGSSLNFTAQPGSCLWNAKFGQFSAEGELLKWHLSTPQTPALFTKQLGGNFCATSGSGGGSSGSGGSGGSGGGSGGGAGGGGGGGGSGTPGTGPLYNVSPPIITDEQGNNPPQVGDTLHVIGGTWNENPTSYSYQWEYCKPAGNCSRVATTGNASSYTIPEEDRGDTIRAVVIAHDSAGASQPVATAETATVGTRVTGLSVYPTQQAYDWSVNGQFYVTDPDPEANEEGAVVDIPTHETTTIHSSYPLVTSDGITRVANNGTVLYKEFTDINTGTSGLFVVPRGAARTLITTEAYEYQLSEDGSTAVYFTITDTGNGESTKTLHSYNVATGHDTVIGSWPYNGVAGTLAPLWIDYISPNGQSGIFGFCRYISEGYATEVCGQHSVYGEWEAEGIISFSDLSSPQLLPPPAPLIDNHENGDPKTALDAASPNGVLILGQDTSESLLNEFAYEPNIGYKEFPKVEGHTCWYLDAGGGGVDEGQSLDTTNGISSNGRYVMCNVETEAHNGSTYMMDLTTGRATLVYGHTYEPALPEWVSENGTEAIILAEPKDGGDSVYQKWISPVNPLP
jgi:hypothetical protein